MRCRPNPASAFVELEGPWFLINVEETRGHEALVWIHPCVSHRPKGRGKNPKQRGAGIQSRERNMARCNQCQQVRRRISPARAQRSPPCRTPSPFSQGIKKEPPGSFASPALTRWQAGGITPAGTQGVRPVPPELAYGTDTTSHPASGTFTTHDRHVTVYMTQAVTQTKTMHP